MSRSEQWSTYAITVGRGFKELLVWIQDNFQDKIDHHTIVSGWYLTLSQHFLIMFTKVCDVFSTQLSVTRLGSYLQ